MERGVSVEFIGDKQRLDVVNIDTQELLTAIIVLAQSATRLMKDDGLSDTEVKRVLADVVAKGFLFDDRTTPV